MMQCKYGHEHSTAGLIRRQRAVMDTFYRTGDHEEEALALASYWWQPDGCRMPNEDDIEEAQDSIDEGDWLVLTDKEADEECKEYIESSVHVFCTSFMSEVTGIDQRAFDALAEDYNEGNEGILHLIEITCGLRLFVREAIAVDGRGHFLNHYDGVEGDAVIGDETYYIYRRN